MRVSTTRSAAPRCISIRRRRISPTRRPPIACGSSPNSRPRSSWRSPAIPTRRSGEEVVLTYAGLDDKIRRTTVHLDPAPTHLADKAASYRLRLQPKQSSALFVAVACDPDEAIRRGGGPDLCGSRRQDPPHHGASRSGADASRRQGGLLSLAAPAQTVVRALRGGRLRSRRGDQARRWS